MFKTIGNTFALMNASWKVLKSDRSLIWFPIMSGIGLAIVILAGIGAFAATGNLAEGRQVDAGGYIVGAVFYLFGSFIVIYFNSALIAAAYVRLQGGQPTVGSALQVANSHLPAIFGWACFSTTIGLIIEQLRGQRGGVLSILGYILQAIWAYVTYFVVPVLVLEGLSPMEAVKRSSSLFRDTWGKQAVSNFGFGLLFFAVAIVATVPVLVALALGSLLAAGIIGVFLSLPIAVIGFAALVAMEGIFRAALYKFATTGNGTILPEDVFRNAYVDKSNRGSWT